MRSYNILGIEVKDKKCNIIEDLLKGKYGFNPTCDCGAFQTYSGLNDDLKSGSLTRSKYTCHSCVCSRPVYVLGVKYKSLTDATNKLFNDKCICSSCGLKFNYNAMYQRIQDGTFLGYDSLLCKECNKVKFGEHSSEILINAHKDPNSGFNSNECKERRSELVKHNWMNQEFREARSKESSIRLTERNIENWKDSEYRSKISSIISDRWKDPEYRSKMSKLASENLIKRNVENWKNPEYRGLMARMTAERNFDKAFDSIHNLIPEYNYELAELNPEQIELREFIYKKYEVVELDTFRYSNFIASKFTGSLSGNHHILLDSIFSKDPDCELYRIDLNMLDHSIAHYLLLMDNITKVGLEDLSTKLKVNLSKVVMALQVRYRFHKDKSEYWTESLLKDIKSLVI